MSISLRIKQIRKEKKLNQAAFAFQLGVSQAAVSRYEKADRQPESDFLCSLANVFNVNTNWLLTGEGPMYTPPVIPVKAGIQGKEHIFTIPVVAPIAAGSPIEVIEDEPLEMLHIPASILSLPPPYYAFRVEGESMHPYIMNGDTVVLSRDWRGIALDGRICGFRTADGITLKKLVLQPKQKTAWLMPLNHDGYKPIPYNKDTEELIMFGVLVLLLRRYEQEVT